MNEHLRVAGWLLATAALVVLGSPHREPDPVEQQDVGTVASRDAAVRQASLPVADRIELQRVDPGPPREDGSSGPEPYTIYLVATPEEAIAVREWLLFANVIVLPTGEGTASPDYQRAHLAARERFPDHPIRTIDLRAGAAGAATETRQ